VEGAGLDSVVVAAPSTASRRSPSPYASLRERDLTAASSIGRANGRQRCRGAAAALSGGLTIGGKTVAEWEAIRPDYEDGAETVVELCTRVGTTKSTLRKAAITFRWRLRSPRRVDRTDIIERLFRLLDTHILEMETSMEGAGRGEAAVLGRLVNTLDRLIEIQDAESKRRHPKSTRQISDIKAKLIERIENLKRG
jgi:hypothetical protein